MWQTGFILEGEDEQTLKDEFVRMSAIYEHRSPYDIAAFVFRNQVDPGLRSQLAAQVWSNDLEIQERIRVAIRLKNTPELPDPEVVKKEILELARKQGATEKDKIAAYRLYLESQGLIVKQVDKKIDAKGSGLPTFIIAQYPEEV